MKQIFLILLMLLLSACAAMPSTSDELILNTDIKQTYCYDLGSGEVAKRVQYFLEKCYYDNKIFQVVGEGIADYKRYSIRTKYGYGISVNIKPAVDGCMTRVDMYALRSHLREKFRRIDDTVKGVDPKCGII